MKQHTTPHGDTFLHRHTDTSSWSRKNRRHQPQPSPTLLARFTIMSAACFGILVILTILTVLTVLSVA